MSKRARFLERQSRDSSTFDGTYQTLGDALSAPGCIVKIVNDSNRDVDISTDGSEDHDFVPQNGFVLYDMRANRAREQYFVFEKGTQFYVKGTAGTGNVYLVVIKEQE